MLDVTENGVAKVDLTGDFTKPGALQELDEEFSRLEIQQAKGLTLVVEDLKDISSEALRFLSFFISGKNRESADTFTVSIKGAKDKVKELFVNSSLSSQISV